MMDPVTIFWGTVFGVTAWLTPWVSYQWLTSDYPPAILINILANMGLF